MPRHRHGPIPPIPPVPPLPPQACGFRFDDFVDMFAMGGNGFRGNWGPFHFDFGDGPGGSGGRGRGGLAHGRIRSWRVVGRAASRRSPLAASRTASPETNT